MKNPSRIRSSIRMIAFTFFSLSLVGGVQASSPINFKYAWTKTIGDKSSIDIFAGTKDILGDIYLTGIYHGLSLRENQSIDFDPSVEIDLHSAGAEDRVFVTKYKKDGTYDWTRTITSRSTFDEDVKNMTVTGITTDSSDNVYIAGIIKIYEGGGSKHYYPSKERDKIYIVKYSDTGTRIWIKKFGMSNSTVLGRIAVDKDDNLYIGGSFIGKDVDFNSSSSESDIYSTNDMTMPVSKSHNKFQDYIDTFITRYNADGSYGWTKVIESGVDFGSYANAINIDNTDGVYMTGVFNGKVDFNPETATDIHTSKGSGDIFITKYDTSGKYLWTRTIGGKSLDVGESIAIDGDTIVILCNVAGDIKFSGKDVELNVSGDKALLLTKYDSNGNYIWSNLVAGVSGNQVSIGAKSQVLVLGSFHAKNIDFDPSDAVDSYSSVDLGSAYRDLWERKNMFISEYKPTGEYLWTLQYSGVNQGLHLGPFIVNQKGDILIGGSFYGNDIDFNPFKGVDTFKIAGYHKHVMDIYNQDFEYAYNNMFLTKLYTTKPKVVKKISKTVKHINTNAQNENKQNTAQNPSQSGTFAKVGIAAVGIVVLLSIGGVVFMKMRKR